MKQERGFTLIEVVAAIIIIGIGFLPMYAIFESGLQHTADTNQQLIANELAEQTIEYIKGVPYSEWVNHDVDDPLTSSDDGQKEIRFTAAAGGSILPVTMPAGWVVDVTLAEKAFDTSGSYAVENRQVTIQQEVVDGNAWLNVNGQHYDLDNGMDPTNIKLKVTKDAGLYTLQVINQRMTSSVLDDVVLYTQTTSAMPECYFYFNKSQHVKINSGPSEKLPLALVKEDTSATVTMVVEDVDNKAELTYYQLCAKGITSSTSNIEVEATDSQLVFRDNIVSSDTITLVSGYRPIVRLEPDSTVLSVKDVKVTNKRLDPLDIEVTSNLLTYTIQTGIINKRFYTTRAQSASHMLYACEVAVKDPQGNERVRIRTTKKE